MKHIHLPNFISLSTLGYSCRLWSLVIQKTSRTFPYNFLGLLPSDWNFFLQPLAINIVFLMKGELFNIPKEEFSIETFNRLGIIISRWQSFLYPVLVRYSLKKESFGSVTTIGHILANRESKRIPGCKEPIGWITLLIALKSVTILHFPRVFL